MSKSLLSTKLPYADSSTSIEDAFNYAVKTINSATVDQGTSLDPSVSTTATNTNDGYVYNGNYSSAATPYSITLVISHGLGVVPSGWYILDQTINVGSGSFPTISFIRTSWTTTQITLTLTVQALSGPVNGIYKILILR